MICIYFNMKTQTLKNILLTLLYVSYGGSLLLITSSPHGQKDIRSVPFLAPASHPPHIRSAFVWVHQRLPWAKPSGRLSGQVSNFRHSQVFPPTWNIFFSWFPEHHVSWLHTVSQLPFCLHHWLILPRQTLSFRAWPRAPSLFLVISFSPVVLNTTISAVGVNPCIFRPDPSSELQTLLTFSCHTWHCPLGINRNLPLKFQHRTLDNFQCSTNLFCPCVFFHLKVLTIGCSNQTLGTTQLPPLSSHPTHSSPLVTRLPSSNSHTCCGFFHLFLSS